MDVIWRNEKAGEPSNAVGTFYSGRLGVAAVNGQYAGQVRIDLVDGRYHVLSFLDYKFRTAQKVEVIDSRGGLDEARSIGEENLSGLFARLAA